MVSYLHRYSHGPFQSHSKRRSKHRRSSSDSQKVLKNGNHSPSTGSKSPPDFSDAKISVSSSSGGYNLYPNPKAIVNPRLRTQDLYDSYPYKKHGTLPRAVERSTARDLFTYSPKLMSKQVYKPERLADANGIKAFSSPKVSPHPAWNKSYVAPNIGSKKDEDNQSSNKKTFQEVAKQNNVNSNKMGESFVMGDTKLPQTKQNNVRKIEDFSILNDSKLSPAKPCKLSNRDIKESFMLGDEKQTPAIQNNINNRKIKESFLLGDAKLAPSESFSDSSISCNGKDHAKKKPTQPDSSSIRPNLGIKPLVLKTFVESPKVEKKSSPKKEIVVDNSVSVEVAVEKSPSPTSKGNSNNVSTTIVTEETTVTNGKGNSKVVTTVTSVTTSLSQGGIKDLEKISPDDKKVSNEKDKASDKNDLNMESEKGSRIIDCTSSCNIVTEVK